jgi:hypothetical protein
VRDYARPTTCQIARAGLDLNPNTRIEWLGHVAARRGFGRDVNAGFWTGDHGAAHRRARRLTLEADTVVELLELLNSVGEGAGPTVASPFRRDGRDLGVAAQLSARSTLRRLRWSTSLGEAMAIGGCARQAARAEGVTPLARSALRQTTAKTG